MKRIVLEIFLWLLCLSVLGLITTAVWLTGWSVPWKLIATTIPLILLFIFIASLYAEEKGR